jgi:hypothetical protein
MIGANEGAREEMRYFNMQTFKINDRLEVVCEYHNTRNGFKHTATLLLDGREQEEVKVNYLNRTWERYEFESVLKKLLDQTRVLSDDQKALFKQKIDGQFREDDPALKQLRAVSAFAALSDIMEPDQQKANEQKLKWLKGLEKQGLTIPDDWDQLSEDEKQRRLDGAIAALGEV